ncbi:hypothetical protein FPSE_06110 [Fusarium pseudograminearum CS3096]|uniref:Rhodopsin domain-containing protein n=1 Tax=Fusarium pseudograminearum (strain CS3096) TaxID=1028729 RepID=K3UNC6_FUSPC|nr:hypothetical protein FPSE_06110 [Fusarium pseudograminearum CS3096]EKJ73716.1 hypothetical protein FPSE_06110 [Fusarium pseudograminearum CS3096]
MMVESSICVTLLRIAVIRLHRIIIWCTLAFVLLSTTTVIIGLFVICSPISTAWGHEGICAPTIVIASLGYLVSTGAVVTDWICAVLPVFMLYQVNMKRASKFSVAIILGVAAFIIPKHPAVSDWEQLDGGGFSGKIHVKIDMEMQSLDRSTTSRASNRSSEGLVP